MNRDLRGEGSSQMKTITSPATATWTTPALSFRGTVGQVLQSGGGKLSIAGSDPGEGRCEKPHEAACQAASQGR
jgi:hypothetical protein